MTQELLEYKSRNRRKKYLMFIDESTVANKYVLSKLKSKYVIVTSRINRKIFSSLRNHPLVSTSSNLFKAYKVRPEKLFINIDVRGDGFQFFPVLNSEVIDRANLLESLGIPNDSWYVCLHNRESNYVPSGVNKEHWRSINDCRNSTFTNTLEGINFIQNAGGYVIRIGSQTESQSNLGSGVVDYTISDKQNGKNDFLIISGAKFILGSSSGLMAIAGALNVPILACNTVPLGGSKLWGKQDLSLPKLYFSEKHGRYLHFKEVFETGVSNYNRCQMFKDNGIRVVENSSDEILYSTLEMMSRLNSQSFNEEKELLSIFNSYFSNNNYSFYSTSKVPSYWLKKHHSLIV